MRMDILLNIARTGLPKGKRGQFSVVGILLLVVALAIALWVIKDFLLGLGLFMLLAGAALVFAFILGSQGDGDLAMYMLMFSAGAILLHIFVGGNVTLLSIFSDPIGGG